MQRALDLVRIADHEPVRAREALRSMFEGGRLLLKPQPEGYYLAVSRFFPLALLTTDAPQDAPDGSVTPTLCCPVGAGMA